MATPNLIVGTPLATTVQKVWEGNSAIRFGTSGVLGNAAFFGLDKMLLPVIARTASKLAVSDKPSIAAGSKWVNKNAASVSFFVSYLMDIALQHFLNAWLVFGLETIGTRELYLSSLATSYTAYFATLCGSTVLQAYLLLKGLPKDVAFWTTIGLGSLVNYFVLTYLNTVAKRIDGSSTTANKVGRGGHLAFEKREKMAMMPIWGGNDRSVRSLDYLTNGFALSNSQSPLAL